MAAPWCMSETVQALPRWSKKFDMRNRTYRFSSDVAEKMFPDPSQSTLTEKSIHFYNISKHSSLHYPSVYFCTFYIFFYSFVQFLCLNDGDERPLFAPSFCNAVDRGRERVANTIYQRWFSSKTTRGKSNSKIFLSHLGTVLFGIQVFSPILYCHSFALRELLVDKADV